MTYSIFLCLLLICQAIDYDAVRDDLMELFPNSAADEGNYGPRLIRLAWHCSGTYRTTDGRGGCDGARIRFDPEAHWADNAGQLGALKLLEPLYLKYGGDISWGDLIVLAANTAIELNGKGPEIPFCAGRVDATDGSDSEWLKPTSIASQTFLIYVDPGVDDAKQIRKVFGYMDVDDWETVALIGGGHAFGRCHASRSGFDGKWTNSPTFFDNQYFQLLDKNADEYKSIIKNTTTEQRQYEIMHNDETLMMLHTDLALIYDESYRKIVANYSQDPEYYEEMFQHSWEKLVNRDLGNKPCKDDPVPVPEEIKHYDANLWASVKSDVQQIWDEDTEDAPQFVRLAWQCAGTYRFTDHRGGCDGGRIRFNPEKNWPANAGLQATLNLLKPIYQKYLNSRKFKGHTVSWADLIIIAGTTALEDLGALEMPFCPGRVDVANESMAALGSKYLNTTFLDPEDGRAGDDRPLNIQMRDSLAMRDFTLREMTVLNGGGHSIGKCHADISGYDGQWTEDPTQFDNSFFTTLLLNNWMDQPTTMGKNQMTNEDGSLIMLHTDMVFSEDGDFKTIAEEYSIDNDKFLTDFRSAWIKLVNSDRYGDVCLNIPDQEEEDEDEDDYCQNLPDWMQEQCYRGWPEDGTRFEADFINIATAKESSKTEEESVFENKWGQAFLLMSGLLVCWFIFSLFLLCKIQSQRNQKQNSDARYKNFSVNEDPVFTRVM